jgi:TonB family protein
MDKELINKFKERIRKRGIQYTLLLSVLLHVVFLSSHYDILGNIKSFKSVKEKRIRITFAPKAKSESKPKQIVNNEDTGMKEKPLDSKFLGEKDQTYARQTTSKNIASFKKAGLGEKTGLRPQKKVEAASKKKSKKKGQRPKKLAKRKKTKKAKKKITLGDLSLAAVDPFAVEKIKPQPELAALGLKTGDRNSQGLAQNNDFIEDLPLGDMTNLNTVEFKYYGFYHRIRKKLEQHWGNSLRQKADIMYKTGRRIPSNVNKITSLSITLDNQGNIVDVLVKSTSGVRELDDAAIESFNKAGPFPNPPKGMLSKGKAIIEWGFVVKS